MPQDKEENTLVVWTPDAVLEKVLSNVQFSTECEADVRKEWPEIKTDISV